MKLIPTSLAGVFLVEPAVFQDERGYFFESFNLRRFRDALTEAGAALPRDFVQDNHSCSSRGVLRGLHLQRAPHAQGKLVRVVKGSVFDAVVDIRPDSPTYGQVFSTILKSDDHRMLWVPAGFAHGFQALEDDTHFLYKTTDYYHRESEDAILWNDADLAIPWPIADALVSEKDQLARPFADFKP